MADRDRVHVTDVHAAEPRRIHAGNTCKCHLRDVPVDIVSEQCRGILGDASEVSVREKSRFHKSLEAVADTQNESASCNQSLDGCRNLLIVKDIGNEFSASVRLVTRRETTAERENLALVDIAFHLVYGVEDVLLRKVAEHAHLHFCTCLAEGFCSIVIAVRSREHREICHRFRYLLALVLEVYLLGLERLDALHTLRQKALHVRLACGRIYFFKFLESTVLESFDGDVLSIDTERAVDS